MDYKFWLTIIFGLFGGLGLFLYGMKLMSDGLQKTAGNRLKIILEKLTSNRFVGMFVGLFVTVLVQSSSATTVMVVGFVNAGLMNLTQALSVILGANIGTTITAQIIAFKITALALPAIGFGAGMLILSKKTGIKYIGEIILGFGLLFYGMSIMTSSFAPLQHHEAFKNVFLIFTHNPIIAVLVGALTTVLVQSSSAIIGITIALAYSGLVDYQAAAALVLGDNIGTTITANLAAIGGGRVAKQAAFGHFLFNFIGVAYMLIIFTPFLAFINQITPGDPTFMAADGTYPYVARHIANVHTLFNVINTIVFLPLLPLLAKLCEKMIKSDDKQAFEYTRLAKVLANTPEIAVIQVRKEVARMSIVAMSTMETTRDAISRQDKSLIEKVYEYEKTLDAFQKELFIFLDVLQTKQMSERAAETLKWIRHTIHDLEEIGDKSKKITRTAFKMIEKDVTLSPIAQQEILEMFDTVIEFAGVVFQAFLSKKKLTEDDLVFEERIDSMHKQFRKNHIKRLEKGSCSLDSGVRFVDIINNLEKIGDHIFTVAQQSLANNAELYRMYPKKNTINS